MLNERPSEHKVVAVSRRYNRHAERELELAANARIWTERDMLAHQVSYVAMAIAVGSLARVVARPLQRRRHEFLSHAQDVEGWVPGEEKVERFALRKSGQPQKYPRISHLNR